MSTAPADTGGAPTPTTAHERGGRLDWRGATRRIGLRMRVTLAFAISALMLSFGMSLLVIGVTRSNLVNQREATATQQVYFNAQNVRSGIRPDGNTLDLLSSLQTPEGSRPVLYERAAVIAGTSRTQERWTARDPEFGSEALPPALRERVLAGKAAKMRFTHPTTGDASLAVGIPIADIDGAYFEIVSLQSLNDTLSSISFTLVGASLAVVLAGAAFGRSASRAILRPLGEVTDAARSLAVGALDTRIRALVDADLEPIVTSFNTMASTLESRIEKDAQFASDVSHELRSPLTTLQASIEVLENNRDDLNERAQAALDLLGEDLGRFRELVEDLLEISRFDAGVMRLELDEVLLTQFVTMAVRAAGYRVPVVLEEGVEIPEEFGDILTALDPRRLARVVANLLVNADKYGEGPVAVHIDADDERIRIMVDDDGPGVPVEDRERIFERFNRAGAANQRGTGTGVGLGLALVAEHVRLHGGTVWVEDAPEGGARFVVEIPRVELDADPAEAPTDGLDASEGEFA